MDDSPAFQGFTCTECGATPPDPALESACPACDGRLATRFAFEDSIDPSGLASREDQYRFGPLLPFDAASAVTIGEGGTPLVDYPPLATDVGVDRLLIKDEGANPTGSIADRGASIAVTAARDAGTEGVTLASTGHAGRSVAAYAGRAGLDAEAFLPSRAPFDCKAMVNVHGGEMSVVGGRYSDAQAAFEAERDSARADLGPSSVYRREGPISAYGEILADLEWTVPDAVVVPAAHGTVVVGLARAIERFQAAGLADDAPDIVVVQPAGCAPIVDAIQTGNAVEPIEHPDTIAGALEIPAPLLGDDAVEAVNDVGGQGIPVEDDAALAAAVGANAEAGVEVGVAGGVALAGAAEGGLTSTDTVVVLNPTAGGTESDVLRSHLMGQGV